MLKILYLDEKKAKRYNNDLRVHVTVALDSKYVAPEKEPAFGLLVGPNMVAHPIKVKRSFDDCCHLETELLIAAEMPLNNLHPMLGVLAEKMCGAINVDPKYVSYVEMTADGSEGNDELLCEAERAYIAECGG